MSYSLPFQDFHTCNKGNGGGQTHIMHDRTPGWGAETSGQRRDGDDERDGRGTPACPPLSLGPGGGQVRRDVPPTMLPRHLQGGGAVVERLIDVGAVLDLVLDLFEVIIIAVNNGVPPSTIAFSMSAPCSIRYSTILKSPSCAAAFNGVAPSSVAALTSAPCCTRY